MRKLGSAERGAKYSPIHVNYAIRQFCFDHLSKKLHKHTEYVLLEGRAMVYLKFVYYNVQTLCAKNSPYFY